MSGLYRRRRALDCDPVSQPRAAGCSPGGLRYPGHMRTPRPRRTARRLCLALAVAGPALAGLAGLLAGCLTTLGPDIRRESHHVRMSCDATRGACMTCHESEAQMTRRMQVMSPAEMSEHMRWMTAVVRPPLVQDWMVADRRGCVECHRVREPRG